ncbi:serine protease [Corallococcus sp. CA053C]|uniref:serine protease n=1 Tax=Corallococcus sp. CA053C TaxID=2316732 RepID=UPI0034CF2610
MTQQLPLKGGATTSDEPAVGKFLSVSSRCTATLVAPRVALTAAHCVDYQSDTKSDTTGTHGTVTLGSGATRTVIQRRAFGSATGESDVALLVLDKACPKTITPISIGSAFPADGTLIRIFGFGCTSESTTCQRTGGDTKQVVTATMGESASLCPGDSGGPVIVDGKIVGVNSAAKWFGGDVFANPTTATLQNEVKALGKEFPCGSNGCPDGMAKCDFQGGRQCMTVRSCQILISMSKRDDACIPPRVLCQCEDGFMACEDRGSQCSVLCTTRRRPLPKKMTADGE